ncbi:MAG: DHA2 family efflux MFS transporter permease subunit [Gammaproteobacteria bacterium]|nr:DHA2 family efflux MFS transporter permease subunit [Gammaproteobacteria bacterium]MCH9743848.1 DHA2 family efflux MFS transporter permease subunit [Gammaproteobacteria bacterium]
MNSNKRLYVILITFTAVLVTTLEILDATIVSVSMDAMRGSLGATINQMSWTMTGYITAAAIVMPLTGFLSQRYGRKNLMLVAIVGFGVASVMCGFSTSLNEIVVLRILQGAFGALLGPLSQSLLADNFAPEEMGKAMAFYGIGLMTAPILGPIIGGVVTEYLGWRWDFFINIPICIIAFIAVWALVKSTAKQKANPIDWTGMMLLVLSIGGLEYVLNRGNELQWFSSPQILITSFVALFAFIFFIMRGVDRKERNIIDFSVFRDKNYSVAVLLLLFFAMTFMAMNAWIPPLLERLQNYPILTAGLTMGPRGIASMVSMLLMPFLLKHVKGHYLIGLGFLFFAIGAFMMSHYNPQVDQDFFISANVLQGLASGFFFVPVSKMAYSTLRVVARDNAAGLFNFARMLGASFGVAIFSNILLKQAQINWHSLRTRMAVSDPTFQHWMHVHHYLKVDSSVAVKLSQELSTQSHTIAYNDAFYLTGIVTLCLIPIAFFLRDRRKRSDETL